MAGGKFVTLQVKIERRHAGGSLIGELIGIGRTMDELVPSATQHDHRRDGSFGEADHVPVTVASSPPC